MRDQDRPVIGIIDYGMGNLFSVEKACEYAGMRSFITSERSNIRDADAVILPGVGAFGNAMENLRSMGMVSAIKDFIGTGRPFFGICLGMQLLMDTSEEFGLHEGLGIVHGSTVRFPDKAGGGIEIKVPQIGWNRIARLQGEGADPWKGSPLEALEDGTFAYFVHSYFAVPSEPGCVLSKTVYEGVEYCSALIRRNIFATQFHPEKSGEKGMEVYRRWARIVSENKRRG